MRSPSTKHHLLYEVTQKPVNLLTCHPTQVNAPTLRLRSHKHEYESGTVWVPVYEFQQTRVCMHSNGSHSHTYESGYL